ncbi:MAG: alpha/beta hydrolase fold protein [Myxococcales bacterium]|nr:alpha/beta hydrolase fold protein [Myxococcales bacterium]
MRRVLPAVVLATVATVAIAGCVPMVRAGDYYARPLERAKSRSVAIEARWRREPAPAGCAATGAPIVFVPALGLTQHSWAGVAEALHACRPRVLVDLPGIGETPVTGSFDDDLALRALVDVIDAVAPDGRVVLAGHSLGGAIAARLAERLGTRVEALVLVAAPVAPFTLNRWERLLLKASVWPPFLHLAGGGGGVRLGLRRVSVGGDEIGPLDVALISDEWSDHRRRGAVREYYRAFLDVEGVRRSEAALDHVRVPTLLVWAADDSLVPGSVLVAAEKRLRAVSPSVEVIPGAGHLVTLSNPAAVAGALDRFLAGLPLAPAPSPAPLAAGRSEIVVGRKPGDRIWGPARELFPIVGINALFPLAGRTDLALVAGLARGGLDRSYPLEAGRLVFTVGAAIRGDASGWSFAYLRATGRFELVWRWGGGYHLDGTLLVDPRNGNVGGYAAVGYTPSAIPWVRAFVGGGALPGDGTRLLVGVEVDARLTGWLY